MRIVFLGTPAVAVPSLKALVEERHEISLVVTRTDRPAGRSGRPLAPPVKRAACELGLEVHQPTRVKNRAFLDEVTRHRPDLLVVVAYGRILTQAVIDAATAGAVNVHFSLLPRYRGAAPVQWALARGERTTGVTTMQINARLDEGDILLQQEVPIAEGEHAPALQGRLAVEGARLLTQTLTRMSAGSLEPRAQDADAATYAPILNSADGEVDPALDAREIEGRVRGFDPWPGVWMARSGRRIRLVEVRDSGRVVSEVEPGQVLALEGDVLPVACGGGSLLHVTRVQPEGRRVMAARDAVNGRQLVPGDRLERIGVASC